ncbi:hypothetical protein DERF_007684 [Dermatophagoides farinae]|uniref:Uncharacterized protein n=1 Tax=Dermatophagoides farinae TaxID=6954 RepID=A0A922I0V7_DERFA|nr:hypothetical protein DERF_007684 [Dermatophagoides farinae]
MNLKNGYGHVQMNERHRQTLSCMEGFRTNSQNVAATIIITIIIIHHDDHRQNGFNGKIK